MSIPREIAFLIWLGSIAVQVYSFEVPNRNVHYQHSFVKTICTNANPCHKVSQRLAPILQIASDTGSSPELESNYKSQKMTRASFLSTLFITTASTSLIAHADDSTTPITEESTIPKKTYQITSCPPKTSSSCISTSSTKGDALKSYVAPWTFQCTPEKAFRTLLDILEQQELNNNDESIKVAFVDMDGFYIEATAKRKSLLSLGGITDRMEFLVKPDDNVILYRSRQLPDENSNNDGSGKDLNDLGANKKRLGRFRQLSNGLFNELGTENDYDYTGRKGVGGNGPLGQLKAFYGLQSGAGFEDVFD